VADQERKVALAQEQAKLEAAEKERLAIAAEREAAEQDVFTVQETAAARRESQIEIIKAERDAQREMINRKNEVELEAFKRIKDAEAEATALNRKAEAEATAAIKMAEARRTEAQAASDAEKLRAEAARATAAADGLAEAEVIRAKADAANQEAEAIKARGLAEAEAIKARGLAEAEGQRAMADALAANEGVAQRLELEKIRVTAQVEIGVAQARALGEALAAMDFKLYGSPDTAQQILRMVTLTDGIGSLVQGAPPALKELGGRLIDRVLPPNGSGNGNGAGHEGQPAQPAGIDLGAARPLIAEGSAILTGLLGAEERRALTLRDGIERAIGLASDDQRAALLRLQGMIALAPALADQTVELVLGSAIVQG
jgi:hypothetical protein